MTDEVAAGGRRSPYGVGDVIGDYRIECLLGRGGMGFVYGAVNTVIGKRAALKVLGRHVAADDMIERFVTEARAVNQIGHPNIVDVFGFGTTDAGDKYMVMEWLRGESLVDRMARPMTAAEICGVLLTIVDALAAAHAKGIVHRDLKPDNVFLHDDGRGPVVKLLDFGIAKLLGSDDQRAERTRTGYLMGTPAYMSPEQARGKDVDHRSDVYSLGVIAFELFAGAQPFEHETPMDLVVAHLQEVPPAPSAVRAEVPAGVDRLVLAMLEKNAAARPTLSQVKVALTAIAQARDGAVTMPPRTPPQTFAATALLDAPPPRSSSTIGLATGQTAAPVASPRRSWRWPAAVTIALAAAALVVFASRSRPRPAPAPPAGATVSRPAPAPVPPPIAPPPAPAAPAPPASDPRPAPAPTAPAVADAHDPPGPGSARRSARPPVAAPPSVSSSPPPPPVVDAAPPAVVRAPAEAVDAGVAAPPPGPPPVRDRDQDGTVDPFAHP
ncbi:MAG: serine/threonine protein kinase [Myxococcales bacterium]|nr:serine/threonine protein kinase [Myxococcales bacterium]MBK7195050.1 serine/threonine protein kinase [Myxococcales bacterium]MBP6848663.1 serine/threonine protein kinase [Kofleriaceae bacterium]